MKVKSNNTLKELCERQKVYTIGGHGVIAAVWRWNDSTLRVFIPMHLDGPIKSWHTDDADNPHLLHGFFAIRSDSDGSVKLPPYADTVLGIAQIYRVATGVILDCASQGDVNGGSYVIANHLTIEIE